MREGRRERAREGGREGMRERARGRARREEGRYIIYIVLASITVPKVIFMF